MHEPRLVSRFFLSQQYVIIGHVAVLREIFDLYLMDEATTSLPWKCQWHRLARRMYAEHGETSLWRCHVVSI